MPVIKALLRRKLVLIGLFIVTAFVIMAVFAPWIAPYPPDFQFDNGLDDTGAPLPPNAAYWLGTDTLGRDLLSRLIFGSRATLIVAIVANSIAVTIGVLIGVTAGYLRGWIGSVLMRFTDLITAFPTLILAILLAALVSQNSWTWLQWLPISPNLLIIMVIIALVNWVQVGRVTYTETTSLVEREFIVAEKSLGAGTARILFRHLLPHVLPTAIVYATLGIATTSLTEATLSFLGIGVQPPTASWGNMANDGQTYLDTAPWLIFFPSICIALLALSFNLIGDALRDILDPTLRGRH
jgi:peptide/nickel transport system permease protein